MSTSIQQSRGHIMKRRLRIMTVVVVVPCAFTSMIVSAGFSKGISSIRRCVGSEFNKEQSALKHFSADSRGDFRVWRKIDWISLAEKYEVQREKSTSVIDKEVWRKACTTLSKDYLQSVLSPFPSPIEAILLDQKRILIKRDDLLRLKRSNASGNKARKMLVLSEMIKDEDFPEALVSYGGPQSNAMLALAAIVASKNESTKHNSKKKRFIYYTKKLPRYLRKQPNGNLLRAQSLGMEIIELPNNQYQQLFGGPNGGSIMPPAELEPPSTDSIWIPQGGAFQAAAPGTKRLAKEISLFWDDKGEGPLSVVVPCGTGTTALLLQHDLDVLRATKPLPINVVAVPCVGDDDYLERQMNSLNKAMGKIDESSVPVILRPKDIVSKSSSSQRNGYFVFGEPSADLLNTFNKMKDDGVYLDLLYGAPAWTILLQHLSNSKVDSNSPLYGTQVMYLHSGGLEGISSQLTRYRHKGLISAEEVQMP